jgi:hypothetical protein
MSLLTVALNVLLGPCQCIMGNMTRLDEPATALQRGAVMGQYRRLGLDRPRQRELRHAVGAALLGLAEVADWRDLTKGQAGVLLRSLQDCASADEAAAAAGLRTPRQAAMARARTRFLTRLLAAWIAAELAARMRQEVTGDVISPASVQSDVARHSL